MERLKALWAPRTRFVSPGSAEEEAEAGVEVTGKPGVMRTHEDRHHKTQWGSPLSPWLPARKGAQGVGVQGPSLHAHTATWGRPRAHSGLVRSERQDGKTLGR